MHSRGHYTPLYGNWLWADPALDFGLVPTSEKRKPAKWEYYRAHKDKASMRVAKVTKLEMRSNDR